MYEVVCGKGIDSSTTLGMAVLTTPTKIEDNKNFFFFGYDVPPLICSFSRISFLLKPLIFNALVRLT